MLINRIPKYQPMVSEIGTRLYKKMRTIKEANTILKGIAFLVPSNSINVASLPKLNSILALVRRSLFYFIV